MANATIALNADDIEIRLAAKVGWAAAQGSGCVVVLATELTDELIRDGYAKDLIRYIQEQRKQLDLAYNARIEVGIVGVELFFENAPKSTGFHLPKHG